MAQISDSMFAHNDMNIPDWRVEVYFWDKKEHKERFLVDCSAIMISDLQLNRSMNKFDSLKVTIEYLQFSKKLKEEGSLVEYVLMPWNTIIKVKRNFVEVFSGPLIHMNLSLSANNKQELELQAMGYGYIFTKRVVNCPLYGSYADICRQLVYEGQHEMNWFSNFSFEYEGEEEYFDDWEWSHKNHFRVTDCNTNALNSTNYHTGDIVYWASDGGVAQWRVKKVNSNGRIEELKFLDSTIFTKDVSEIQNAYLSGGSGQNAIVNMNTETNLIPCRSQSPFHNGGIHLGADEWIQTKVNPEFPITRNSYNIPALMFRCVHKNENNSILTITFYDNENNILYTRDINLSVAEDWTQLDVSLSGDSCNTTITYVRLQTNSSIDITDLQIYAMPEEHDVYDYYMTANFEDFDDWDNSRESHFHYEIVYDLMEKLTQRQNDNFEFWFDTNRQMIIRNYIGDQINDIGITYPGDVQSIKLEREIENIFNVNVAQAEQSIQYKDAKGEEQQGKIKWVGTYGSYDSINEFGVFHEQNVYEGVDRQEDLDEKALGDLKIYSYVDDLPEIMTDANIYSIDKIDIGKVLTLKVLSDQIFSYVNGEYRVYSWTINVTNDAVEKFSFKLIPIDKRHLQLISFPKMIKTMNNNIRRALLK